MPSRSFSFEPNWYNSVNSFEALGLKSSLLKTIRSNLSDYHCLIQSNTHITDYKNFVPTSIQSKAILSLLKAKDTIAQAPSGSGKTTTIAISVLQIIDEDMHRCKAIVLNSSNKISVQVKQQIMGFEGDMNISIEICNDEHTNSIKEGNLDVVQILIGTPEDIVSALKKGILKKDFVKLLVLDEVDHIVEQGFINEVRELFEIFRKENKDTQLALFASEVPSVIMELCQEFMESPAITQGRNLDLSLEGVKQFYVNVERDEWKFETLLDLLTMDIAQCVVFCNKKTTVEYLSNKMRERNFTISQLHADLSPRECETNSREFRIGATKIMIMTDALVRSRYCPYEPNLSIHYDIPKVKENYMNRIGRSGKFGRKSVSISFVTVQEVLIFRELERYFNTDINELPLDFTNLL